MYRSSNSDCLMVYKKGHIFQRAQCGCPSIFTLRPQENPGGAEVGFYSTQIPKRDRGEWRVSSPRRYYPHRKTRKYRLIGSYGGPWAGFHEAEQRKFCSWSETNSSYRDLTLHDKSENLFNFGSLQNYFRWTINCWKLQSEDHSHDKNWTTVCTGLQKPTL